MSSIVNVDESKARNDLSALFSYTYPPPFEMKDHLIGGSDVPLSGRTLKRFRDWRHERVATAAYYLAQKRSFNPGDEIGDWLLAEAQADLLDRVGE